MWTRQQSDAIGKIFTSNRTGSSIATSVVRRSHPSVGHVRARPIVIVSVWPQRRQRGQGGRRNIAALCLHYLTRWSRVHQERNGLAPKEGQEAIVEVSLNLSRIVEKNDRLHNSPMYSRHLYLSVWGTCLRVSKHEFKTDLEIQEAAPLISTFSMQDAEAGLATDYTKRKHVIRVRIPNGPQFLIRCETERDAVLWIDAMQASINVSCDLDTRPMPEFAFARRRRLHHRGHSRRRRGAGSSS